MSGLNSVLKLEMTSYSNNAYDITTLFCCFEKFLAYTLFLPNFIVVRHQMVELNQGAFLPPPPIHIRGIPDPVQNRVNFHRLTSLNWEGNMEFRKNRGYDCKGLLGE